MTTPDRTTAGPSRAQRHNPAVTEAVRRVQEDGLTIAAAAREVGVSYGAVFKRLNPERQVAYNRRTLEQRHASPEKKRATDRAYEEAHRAACVNCGGQASRKSTLCRCCLKRKWDRIHNEIIQLRQEGMTNVQIAERVGLSSASVGTTICRLRQRGVDIPPSPHYLTGRGASA